MPDPAELVALLEEQVLEGSRRYTRGQVAERSGVPLEQSERLWRSLGFTTAGDDDVVFGDADVEALRTIAAIAEAGIVSEAAPSPPLAPWARRWRGWRTGRPTCSASTS